MESSARARAHTRPRPGTTLRGAGLYHFPNHDGRRGGHLPHVPRVQRHGDRGLASEALRTRSEPRGPDAVGSSRRFAFGPAPRRAGGVLPRARTGGGVSPSIAGGPLVSAGPRVSPCMEAQRTRKGVPGGAPPAGRAEAGPLGAVSAPPGKRGARVSGGSSPLPFPQSPSLRGCLPAPSPPAAEASIPSARGPGAADVFKAVCSLSTPILFSPQ